MLLKQVTSTASALVLASGILLSAVLCAPASSKQQQPQPKLDSATSASSATTTTTTIAATDANSKQQPASTQRPVSMAAPLRLSEADEQQYTGSFEGKNPFSDNSLWQIPIQFVSELSSNSEAPSRDQLAKSASEAKSSLLGDHVHGDEASLASNDDDHNDDDAAESPRLISASTKGADLKTAAGYHHATPHYHDQHHGGQHHGDHYASKYYQYASVPYPYAWDFGYRRGNPYHTIERHEHGKGPHFQTKVKWSDKYGGHGVHVWDYNHDSYEAHQHAGHDGHHGHDTHHGYDAHRAHGYGHH